MYVILCFPNSGIYSPVGIYAKVSLRVTQLSRKEAFGFGIHPFSLVPVVQCFGDPMLGLVAFEAVVFLAPLV